MKRMKRILTAVLAVALFTATMVPASAHSCSGHSHSCSGNSGSCTNICNATTCVAHAYTGCEKKLTITLFGETMVEDEDFVVVGTKPVDAGTYELTIQGIASYTGTTTITYQITKASKPVISVCKKAQKILKNGVKCSKLQNKSKKIKLKVDAGDSVKLTYKVVGKKAKQYVTVSKKGVVTLKKGTPKGTYKIKVKCCGSANYEDGCKVYKIKVK